MTSVLSFHAHLEMCKFVLVYEMINNLHNQSLHFVAWSSLQKTNTYLNIPVVYRQQLHLCCPICHRTQFPILHCDILPLFLRLMWHHSRGAHFRLCNQLQFHNTVFNNYTPSRINTHSLVCMHIIAHM